MWHVNVPKVRSGTADGHTASNAFPSMEHCYSFTDCFSGTDSESELKRCLSLARKAALITCPQSQLRVRQLVHFILQSLWILNGSTADTCTWEMTCGCSHIYPFCGEHSNIGDSLAGSHYVRMSWLSCKVDGPMSHVSRLELDIHYPYWQCDWVSCCLYQRVPLQFCFGVTQTVRAQAFSQVHSVTQVTTGYNSGRSTLLQVSETLSCSKAHDKTAWW